MQSYAVLGGYKTGLNQLRLRPVRNRPKLVLYSILLYYFIQFGTHMTFLHFREIPKNRNNQE
jgi:hypothetical protein